jgi:iron complex transport system ATP-binding protein
MNSILTLEKVSFRYGENAPNVLSGLSLAVPAGMVSAVLGPNGTGKTTLLHIMLGLLKPASGLVRLRGKPLSGYSRRRLSQMIGLVPQFERIPFNLSVSEYLLLGRAPYLRPFQVPGEEDTAHVTEALAAVGIDHLAQKPAQELSGGELQLAHIARIIVQKPRLLLLDEPTAHLDLRNQHRVLGLLKALCRQTITTVFTTHDPNAAIHAADHFVLMHGGRVAKQGGLQTVITEKNLSAMYHIPIRVASAEGRTLVVMESAP